MAKHPNKSPEKGFLKELVKAPAQVAEQKKPLDWKAPLSGLKPEAAAMGVPRRLSEHKAVGRPKSNIAAEAAQVAAKRRG